ncbi:copper chaperone PCu(A)C, partial [Mesorhizobium sp. M7A.F.Ca.US.003.02.2.1]
MSHFFPDAARPMAGSILRGIEERVGIAVLALALLFTGAQSVFA